MPDEFWFEVTSMIDVFATDGSTVIGSLQPGVPYRALDANDHWLAIPGPNGARGFVAIAELRYREIEAPGASASDVDDARVESDRTGDHAEHQASVDESLIRAGVHSAEAAGDANGKTDAHTADPGAATVTPSGEAQRGDEEDQGTMSPGGDADTASSVGVTAPAVAMPQETKGMRRDDGRLNGSHDTTAYIHAASEQGPTGDAEDEDPSERQRRLRLFAAGAAGLVVLLIILISMFGGGDSPPPTSRAAASTTTIQATTTTTSTLPVATTLPPVGTTPASANAPKNWRIVFYNDFEQSRDEAFPVGEITANATGSLVDGTYLVEAESQRVMETLLQVPLTSRFAYFGATIGETRLEAGAHVCGLLFSTNEELYVVTINAEVASGPREYAIVDGSGNEILPVTGSTTVHPEQNHVALLVRAPSYRLYINGEQVARGKVEGNQLTGFGLTYGASSSGQCWFDDLEVWRPPPPPPPEELDRRATEELTTVLLAEKAHLTEEGAYTDSVDALLAQEPDIEVNTTSPDDAGVFVELPGESEGSAVCLQQHSGSGTYLMIFDMAGSPGSTYYAASTDPIPCPTTGTAPESTDTVAWSARGMPDPPATS